MGERVAGSFGGTQMAQPCDPVLPSHLRLSLLVQSVDLAPDEHADFAFGPSLFAVE